MYLFIIPTNPFSLNIDFSSYSQEGRENLAANSSFMQGFYNAMSVLANNGMAFGSYSCGTSAGCGSAAGTVGSCSVGGGFTSLG